MLRTALGIDFGATKIACALVSSDGNFAGEIHVEPTGHTSPLETMENLFRCIDRALSDGAIVPHSLAGIGIGSTGPITAAGTFGDVDTLPHMWGFAMGDAVAERYGVAPIVDNDANCFALAEARFGAGRAEPVVIGITLGTGFGCGFTIGGKVIGGATGNAGEVGRCLVNGRAYDDALSGGGVARIYQDVTGQTKRAEEVLALAEQHDAAAIETWRRYGARLGSALGVIGAVLDPGTIVLGGSVAAGFWYFRAETEAAMKPQMSTPTAARVRLCPSTLGRKAACLGAAALAFD